MNKLPSEKRVQIIRMHVEGNSLRSTSRMADVSINTVTKLLIDTGKACQQFHNDTVMKLQSERVQWDEIWSFSGCKEKAKGKGADGEGQVWTWTALDADSKLIISWLVGDRDADTATVFMQDVRDRLQKRVQLTRDSNNPHLQAVTAAFDYDVDYAMLLKIYGGSEGTNDQERKYSPDQCTGAKKTKEMGDSNLKFDSTSYVERSNRTMRMHMRTSTRSTNAFSKRMEKHCYAIALHFVYYNFAKIHKSLSVTPAMQSGLTKRVMTIEDIADLSPLKPLDKGVIQKNK